MILRINETHYDDTQNNDSHHKWNSVYLLALSIMILSINESHYNNTQHNDSDLKRNSVYLLALLALAQPAK
jgi:hypothetical protein